MQAAAMLKKVPKPTDKEIDTNMQGNICRCGTYQRIRQAIKQAAGGGGMIERFNVSRRGFLGQIFSAGALVIGVPLAYGQQSKTWQPSVYLGIEPNGDVKIVAHRSEMGTGRPHLSADDCRR